jgi:hypothetical protein
MISTNKSSAQKGIKQKLALAMTGATIATFLQSNIVLAAGYFTKSCSNITLNQGRILEADCKRRNGSTARTGINLNNYITNINGTLVWTGRGNYIATSRNCHVVYKPNDSFLKCDVHKGNGIWISSTLNLDRHIANLNGNLSRISILKIK